MFKKFNPYNKEEGMSILGDIEDGIKKTEQEIEQGAHFIVKDVTTLERKIMVDLSHVEATFDVWMKDVETSITGDTVILKERFLSLLKGI